jgi:thioesterase domain-containing protein
VTEAFASNLPLQARPEWQAGEPPHLDAFIGGGADDLMPGGGVLRDHVRRYAAETGRATAYFANSRVGRVVQLVGDVLRRGGSANLIGHSWGGPDAYRAASRLARDGLYVASLITLDPVAGPFRRPRGAVGPVFWLNVSTTPEVRDRSDRLTRIFPLSRKPSSLPLDKADQAIELNLHHWDVDRMMSLGGGRARLDIASPAGD